MLYFKTCIRIKIFIILAAESSNSPLIRNSNCNATSANNHEDKMEMISSSTPNRKMKDTKLNDVVKGNSLSTAANNSSNNFLDLQMTNEIYKKSFFSNNYNTKIDHNIHVKLETKALWTQFAEIGTEMIITKCGRYL